MFPPKKKKPGLAVVIGVGRAKPKEPDTPDSLESPAPKRRTRSLFDHRGETPPLASRMDPSMGGMDGEGMIGRGGMSSRMADEEAGETPEQEAQEESGGDLISDIERVGEEHGMDAGQSRAFAADLLGAIAECLRRGSGEGPQAA